MGRHEPVADIVATQGPVTWAIEAKTTLSLALMEQAEWWTCFAEFVSIAVPQPSLDRRGLIRPPVKGRALAERTCSRLGIGIILLSSDGTPPRQGVPPRLHRRHRVGSLLRDHLHPAQKTFAPAGNPEGAHWSPFKQTCEALREIVGDSPGIGMKHAVERLKEHHYCSDATALSALRQWGRRGVIKGVEFRKVGRSLELWPADGCPGL